MCEVTSVTGSGNCAQNSAQTGFWTKYTYDLMGDMTGVTQNAQAATNSQQTRTYTYDMMSRILTETNPETGNTTYVYDTDSACGTTPYPGNLVKRVDANGNVTCYVYDNLQRVLSISYLPGGPNVANTPKKTFVYGTATTTTINSVVLNKTADRMVEAYTSSSSCTSKCTDLLFSYSPRGEVTDVYESTPNSGTGYYHANSQYWANGALNALSLLNASGTALIPAITYSADAEGRTSAITAASGTNPVYSTTYNTASQVTGVNYMAAGSDNDIFTFDPNTFRITDYQFNVGSPAKQDWGHLNWNQNGTLGSLAITDPLNTTNSQTCTYTYDDLGRLASKNPATPNIVCGTKWSQTISLDAFGNISKAATVGTSFQASYVPPSGPPTNRIVQIGSLTPTYDTNGNLTYDATTSTTHQYTWDADGKMLTIDNGSSSGVCLTYDALGRMVEQGRGATCATHTQLVYSPGGFKLALLNGQTLQKAFVPLTGGATAVYNTSGLQYFRHTDWLGSSRLATTPNRAMYYDTAYAPFGEDYVGATGTGGAKDLNFTGQNEDTVSWMYDFMFRQYNQTHGRWMSPDPGGLNEVDPGNPQTWNRYAYVMNQPSFLTDPLGLGCYGDITVYWYIDSTGSVEIIGIHLDSVRCDGGGGQGGGGGGGNGPQKQTPQQKQKQCISNFYNSAAGKAVQFGSPLALLPGWNPRWGDNARDWAVAIFGKGGGVFGSGITPGTNTLTTLSGTTTVGSTLELGAEAVLGTLEKAALPAMAVATLADIAAHSYCAGGPTVSVEVPGGG